MTAFLTAVKQILDVRVGATGDPMDREVTFNDLVDVQLANATFGTSTGNGGSVSATDIVVPSYVAPTVDYTPPAAPSGLSATASLTAIVLAWTSPTDSNYDHTEIWRAASNNAALAVKIDTTNAQVYADAVGATATRYYYWLKGVSKAGVVSLAFNAANGATAQTGLIGGQDLTNLIIDASKLANSAVDATKIANAAIGAAAIQNGAITNAAIQDAAITNAKIASLDAGKINTGFLSAGVIAANSITGDKINVTGLDAKLATISSAYVNTLNIAGNAITAPAGNLQTARTAVTTSYATAVSDTVDSAGQPVFINVSVPFYINDSVGNYLLAKVYRDGVLLTPVDSLLGWAVSSGFTGLAGATAVAQIATSVLSFGLVDKTPGTGSHTYSVQVAKNYNTGTVYVWNCSIHLLGVKR
jgi:hypothetical protein